jgi:hypothetical protein
MTMIREFVTRGVTHKKDLQKSWFLAHDADTSSLSLDNHVEVLNHLW